MEVIFGWIFSVCFCLVMLLLLIFRCQYDIYQIKKRLEENEEEQRRKI